MTLGIGASMFSTPGSGYFTSQSFGEPKLSSTFPDKVDQIDPLQNQLCRVCEEPAAGFHFGAFTCEGCKSFFGRTCNNQSVIQECKNSYRCVVDKKNRTACKACRLRKCLMVGMSKSGSRYGRRSNWFKIHCLMQQPPSSSPSRSSPQPRSWIKSEDNPQSTDKSFSSNSRSPSPENPRKRQHLNPDSPPPAPTSPLSASETNPTLSLSHIYNPLLMGGGLGAGFPFYKLSPLFNQNPFLAHPLLYSINQRVSSHLGGHIGSPLDLLQEHRELLARFSGAPVRDHSPDKDIVDNFSEKSIDHSSSQSDRSIDPCDQSGDQSSERSLSPEPMDLSVKMESRMVVTSQPVSSSSRKDEDEEDRIDKNRNLLFVNKLNSAVHS